MLYLCVNFKNSSLIYLIDVDNIFTYKKYYINVHININVTSTFLIHFLHHA